MSTVDSLITKYAQPIAASANLDPADYDPTAAGLAALLRDTADHLSPMDQTADWLTEAAADLDAIARLGDGGHRTQKLLDGIDAALYEAKSDLELC